MREISFFVEDRHRWLDQSHPGWAQANLGSDGSNLTLVFLSLNRSSLSMRLVRSLAREVPHFAGRVLAVDNGSTDEEFAALEAFLAAECPFPYDVLKLGFNAGVGGGRNRGFAAAKTDWILSLDNDIYLTGNPFPRLQKDVALLGCHFLSVPLVNPDLATFFSFGGHLNPTLIEGAQPFLGTACMLPPGAPLARAAEVSPAGEGFLCSFLFGGASVLRRSSFLAAGGFDDAMLVGFEDIEFSLRLFQAGIKVGSSAVADFVHDHPPAETDGDKGYERTRYSRGLLKASAEHFERKHGFRVWSRGVDEWLAGREQHQGMDVSTPGFAPAAAVPSSSRKPKIALVVDSPDWAYANIARQIEKNLSDRYEFEIIATFDLGETERARWADEGRKQVWAPGGPRAFAQVLLRAAEFDLVHVFWRPLLTLLGDRHFYGAGLEEYANFLGFSLAEFRRRFVAPACFTTSVYDHLYLEGESADLMAPVFQEHAAGFTVSSERLARMYREHGEFPAADAVISDGVDPDLFGPADLGRFDAIGDREIVVGWVGNSRWVGERDSKGVNTILRPAIEQLRADGVRVVAEFADRALGFIPHHRMADYYRRIDVLVCTSEIEGTPNPVLEAMACGVPVVSTDVGIVPDALGPLGREFILPERSVDALKGALRRLAGAPDLFRRLSAENLEQAKAWAWPAQTGKFDAFFSRVLARKAAASGEARTKICMLPFTTPSQEPTGAIRLCSAASIFMDRDGTNMGNAREEGLEAVWRGEKYRRVRRTLLEGGEELMPYCAACEYRHDGPAWLLQLHTGLHAYHNGIRTPDVLAALARRLDRYDEYRALAGGVGLAPYGRPDDVDAAERPYARLAAPEAIVDGRDLPIYMDLNTLNRCNVSCTMCPPAIKYDTGIDREDYYRLTVEEFGKLTKGVNLKSAHFVGAYAEPLLNKDLFDLVGRAHEDGAFTAITTNAMPLVPQFSRKLLDAGLDMMSISLHGATKATAETIMKRSKFERVLDNIRVLQRMKMEAGTAKPDIYFNFVSQIGNIRELPDFIDLAADLGVRHVQVIHLIDGDEVVDSRTNLIHFPELLARNVREAQRRGRASGVNVYVSPAYAGILADWPEETTDYLPEAGMDLPAEAAA